MLKIQEFISCFDDIEEANVYLGTKLHLDITNNCLHNLTEKSKVYIYNKSKYSDMDNSLVREANGLILDESNALLSKGPDHHYEARNVGDLPKGFRVNRSNAEEMTTGVMITVFNYKGVWVIASGNSINDVDYTIDVKRCIGKGLDSWWTSIFEKGKDYIYVFDFISKEYENIWPCPTFKLFLLTVIDKSTGEEFDSFAVDDISADLGFARPRHKMVAGRRSLSSFISGVRIPSRGIILNNNGLKVKLPNPLYYSVKTADKVEDRIDPIHVVKIFLACENDMDMMVISKSFPKYAGFLSLFDKTMDKFLQDLTSIWGIVQQFINEPEKFAAAVPPSPLSHLLFMYKNKQIKTLKEGIKKLSPHKLINITKNTYEKEFKTNHEQLKTNYENRTLPY